jgi:hypothetical protein
MCSNFLTCGTRSSMVHTVTVLARLACRSIHHATTLLPAQLSFIADQSRWHLYPYIYPPLFSMHWKMKEDEDYQLERTAVAERRHMPNSCDFKGGRTYSVDPVPIMRRKDHRKRQVSVHPWSKLVHQQHGYCGNQPKHRTGQKGWFISPLWMKWTHTK